MKRILFFNTETVVSMSMIIIIPHDSGAECCGRNISGKDSVTLSGVLVKGQTGFVMSEVQFGRFCQRVQQVPAVYGVVLADTDSSWHYATLDELLLLYAKVAPMEIPKTPYQSGSVGI